MNYSIGQVAEKFDLSIHTLRYYEKEGLLPAIKRTGSGIRQFDDQSIEDLRLVECLKKTGMPLRDIRTFQEWTEEGESSLTKRKELFEERKQVVLKQIQELQSVMDLVDFKIWYYGEAAKIGSEQKLLEKGFDNVPKDIQELYIKTH